MQEEALFLKHIFPLPYYIPYLELLVIKNVYQVHKMLKRISKGTFFVDGSPFRHFNNTYVYTLSIHKLSSERSVSFTACWGKGSDKLFCLCLKYTNYEAFFYVESLAMLDEIPTWYLIIVIFSNYIFGPCAQWTDH